MAEFNKMRFGRTICKVIDQDEALDAITDAEYFDSLIDGGEFSVSFHAEKRQARIEEIIAELAVKAKVDKEFARECYELYTNTP